MSICNTWVCLSECLTEQLCSSECWQISRSLLPVSVTFWWMGLKKTWRSSSQTGACGWPSPSHVEQRGPSSQAPGCSTCCSLCPREGMHRAREEPQQIQSGTDCHRTQKSSWGLFLIQESDVQSISISWNVAAVDCNHTLNSLLCHYGDKFDVNNG